MLHILWCGKVLYISKITADDASARAQFGLFHGDPHPGNIFALPDGRIAYCDFGNVAELSSGNKQTLIDAVVHAVNEDYFEMAQDFIKLVRTRTDDPVAVSIAHYEMLHSWPMCVLSTMPVELCITATLLYE